VRIEAFKTWRVHLENLLYYITIIIDYKNFKYFTIFKLLKMGGKLNNLNSQEVITLLLPID